jgi:hypothetical protein
MATPAFVNLERMPRARHREWVYHTAAAHRKEEMLALVFMSGDGARSGLKMWQDEARTSVDHSPLDEKAFPSS